MVEKESLKGDCNILNSSSNLNHASNISSQRSIKNHFVLLLNDIKQMTNIK